MLCAQAEGEAKDRGSKLGEASVFPASKRHSAHWSIMVLGSGRVEEKACPFTSTPALGQYPRTLCTGCLPFWAFLLWLAGAWQGGFIYDLVLPIFRGEGKIIEILLEKVNSKPDLQG